MKTLLMIWVNIHGRGKSARKNSGLVGRRNTRTKEKKVNITIGNPETKLKTYDFKKVALDRFAEEPTLRKVNEKLI